MLPVLFRLGPITLYTYSVLLNLGIALGLIWLYRAAPVEKKGRWVDIGLAAAVGGLIGARLLYVLVNGAYYAAHVDEALSIWRGGLSWPGAVAVAWLGAWLWARRTGEPLLPVLDTLSVSIALLSLLTWGGCLAAGCAYGAEVTPGQAPEWMISIAPDIYGLQAPRWSTQAAGLLWSGVVLVLIVSIRGRRWPVGARGLYTLGLVALGAFFISFWRGDPMPLVAGYRLDVIGSALVLVGAAAAWALVIQRRAMAQTMINNRQ